MEDFAMELTKKYLSDYQNADKQQKGMILDEFAKLTKLKRNTVQQRFHRTLFKKPNHKIPKKRGPKQRFGKVHAKLLKEIWKLAGLICGERLHPQIDLYLDQLIKNDNLEARYTQAAISLIRSMSLITTKRIISTFPKAHKQKERKGNPDIHKYIPVKANFGKNTIKPGYVEVDYVEHSGGNSSGTFAITGTYVSLFSQWTVRAAGLGKHTKSVGQIHSKASAKIPHQVNEYHPDNCPAILRHLFDKMQGKEQKIKWKLSRSRPYQKNDNAHVEQKNDDKVRKLVGYFRYDTEEFVQLLNELYDYADLYDNFFIASMKLERKIRNKHGRVIKKIYGKPKTPYERLMESPDVDPKIKRQLKQTYESLDMVMLRNKIDNIRLKLLNLAESLR